MLVRLKHELGKSLRKCQEAMNEGDTSTAKTFYDHAFGKLQMFVALFPNEYDAAAMLWMEIYRPKFIKIIYGG